MTKENPKVSHNIRGTDHRGAVRGSQPQNKHQKGALDEVTAYP